MDSFYDATGCMPGYEVPVMADFNFDLNLVHFPFSRLLTKLSYLSSLGLFSFHASLNEFSHENLHVA